MRQRIVVKIGGRIIKKNIARILDDLKYHVINGTEFVIVHGGGDYVTEYSMRMGIQPRFVTSPSGIRSRYTDERELDVFVMVMAGKINKEIVSRLYERGVKAVGLSGADGGLLVAERKRRILIIDERGRKRVIDGGYTGKIRHANPELLTALLDLGYVPVIAPIAISPDGTLLNVDADQAAFSIAKALRPHRLIMLTDVDGVVIDNKVVEEIRVNEIDELLPKIGQGMNRKLIEAREACNAGVKEVIIANGQTEKPITQALNDGGTRIMG